MSDSLQNSGQARDKLRQYYPDLFRLTETQVSEFGAEFVQKHIFTPGEQQACTTGAQFANYLSSRSDNQINSALEILTRCPVFRGEVSSTSSVSEISSPGPPETQPNDTIHEKQQFLQSGENVSNGERIIEDNRVFTPLLSLIMKGFTGLCLVVLVIQLVILQSSTGTLSNSGQRTTPQNGTSPTPFPWGGNGESQTRFGPGDESQLKNATSQNRGESQISIGPSVESQLNSSKSDVVLNVNNTANEGLLGLGESKSINTTSTTFTYLQDMNIILLKNAFQHDNMLVVSVDAVSSIRYFKSLICNKTMKKALGLEVSSTFHSSQFQMPCEGDLNGLDLAGNMTVENVHQILVHSPNIEYLTIDARDICSTVDLHWEDGDMTEDIELLMKIDLPKLKYFKISNFTAECSDLVHFLDEKLASPNIETVVLENFNVHVGNLEWVENMITTRPNLQSFSFTGKLCPSCELFQRRVFNGSLKALSFFVEENNAQNNFQNQVGLASVKNLIANLQHFVSNVEIPRNRKLLGSLKNVRVMNMKLGLAESVSQLSASFLNFFPNLAEGSVQLKFNNRNVCQSQNDTVKITNLKKYVEPTRIRSLVITASCRLDAVKGWELFCRDYHFVRSNTSFAVVLNGTDSNRCNSFWNSPNFNSSSFNAI